MDEALSDNFNPIKGSIYDLHLKHFPGFLPDFFDEISNSSIFHMAGDGLLDRGFIFPNGETYPTEAFIDMLTRRNIKGESSLRLIFLNCCSQEKFAHQLCSEDTNVIYWDGEVSKEIAPIFATWFYSWLKDHHGDFENAFREACTLLVSNYPESVKSVKPWFLKMGIDEKVTSSSAN